jgi:tRNA U55 pseudouridine synthase TruB
MLKKTPLSSRTHRRIAQDIFLLDKPVGPTSFAFIQQYKEYLEGEYGAIEKIGHAGTLDPLASGAMIVGVNQGTKHLDTYLKLGILNSPYNSIAPEQIELASTVTDS